MNSSFIKITSLFLLLTILISACYATHQEQSDITPSKVISTEVTESVTPEIQPVMTATILPTVTLNPNLIIANSPDNKYTIELTLAETPINLTILDNVSKQKTQIPISYKGYNKIEDDGSTGFRWFTDNKILMFVLYREPFPEKIVEDFSCFFAIDVEQAKLLTTNFSSIYRHVWIPDKTGFVTIEHSGLNDIFDYYFPETNCYKSTLDNECEESNVLMDGTPLK
jgi:hypothetical protein